MTDARIDALVAAADPVAAGRLDVPAFDAAGAELRGAIARTAPPPAARVPRRPRWPAGRLAVRTAAVALLGAAAVAVAASVGVDRLGDGSRPAWSAPLLRVAEASPRVLIGAEGWAPVRADEFDEGIGEVTFARGGESAELRWSPAAGHRGLVEDRRRNGDLERRAEVLGRPAVVFRYADSDSFTAVWRADGSSLELRQDGTSLAAFTALLGSLRAVGVDEWLGALPAGVVRPDARAAAVDEMLAGIPLPPGFDLAALRAGDGLVRDRYQLGARVAGAVACAWIGRWAVAREAGDVAAAGAAAAAMATSRGWPVLREMNAEGDYPEVLWELASAMPADAPVSGGRPMSITESYEAALGCPLP